jgi:hypothetical protein
MLCFRGVFSNLLKIIVLGFGMHLAISGYPTKKGRRNDFYYTRRIFNSCHTWAN